MNERPATRAGTKAGACRLRSSVSWMAMRNALLIGIPLLALTACSSRPPQASSAKTKAAPAQPVTCAPSQLAFSLDTGHGRFNGMSHSGTALVLRNRGTSACAMPAQPLPTFMDANKNALNMVAQDLPDSPPASPAITLEPGATITSDLRWVSGDVFDHGHCESPAAVTLTVGKQTVTTDFTGHLCGPDGQPSSYRRTPFKSAVATTAATTDAKTLTYDCAGGRILRAVYPDTDTAVLTFDGQTHELHTGISADGARYVGKAWQWWTKGMHGGRLAPLKPGEATASASGVSCTAR